MDDRAKKEIEEKGYENILKDFANNKYTEYCYDWQGLDADIILPCIEQALSEIERLNNIIKEVREYIMSELITEWDIKNDGYVSGSDLPVDAITPILEILDKEKE